MQRAPVVELECRHFIMLWAYQYCSSRMPHRALWCHVSGVHTSTHRAFNHIKSLGSNSIVYTQQAPASALVSISFPGRTIDMLLVRTDLMVSDEHGSLLDVHAQYADKSRIVLVASKLEERGIGKK